MTDAERKEKLDAAMMEINITWNHKHFYGPINKDAHKFLIRQSEMPSDYRTHWDIKQIPAGSGYRLW